MFLGPLRFCCKSTPSSEALLTTMPPIRHVSLDTGRLRFGTLPLCALGTGTMICGCTQLPVGGHNVTNISLEMRCTFNIDLEGTTFMGWYEFGSCLHWPKQQDQEYQSISSTSSIGLPFVELYESVISRILFSSLKMNFKSVSGLVWWWIGSLLTEFCKRKW